MVVFYNKGKVIWWLQELYHTEPTQNEGAMHGKVCTSVQLMYS